MTIESYLEAKMEEQQTKKLVYVVDDDEVIRDLIGNFLTFSGYDVQAFPNGLACSEALSAQTPDAIITDIHMPYVNGFQLLSISRRVAPDTPVLFITAFAHFRRFFADKTARADGYLEKPFSLEALDNWCKNFIK